MNIGQKYTCIFCLESDALELRLDKKSKPFFICECCGARTFLRGKMSLRGPELLWRPLTLALQAGETAAAQVIIEKAQHSGGAVAHG